MHCFHVLFLISFVSSVLPMSRHLAALVLQQIWGLLPHPWRKRHPRPVTHSLDASTEDRSMIGGQAILLRPKKNSFLGNFPWSSSPHLVAKSRLPTKNHIRCITCGLPCLPEVLVKLTRPSPSFWLSLNFQWFLTAKRRILAAREANPAVRDCIASFMKRLATPLGMYKTLPDSKMFGINSSVSDIDDVDIFFIFSEEKTRHGRSTRNFHEIRILRPRCWIVLVGIYLFVRHSVLMCISTFPS